MSSHKQVQRTVISLSVVAVLAVAFVLVNQYVNKTGVGERDYERREAAKDFDLPVIGKSQYYPTQARLSLTEARKKPLLLHFWASWCHVCREEKPDLDAFWAKHKDDDIVVVGIASFDTKEAMDNSKLIADPTFTVILDEEGTVADSYKVSALPVSVLVDEEGFIVRKFKGTMKPYDFAAVETYLASRKKAH